MKKLLILSLLVLCVLNINAKEKPANKLQTYSGGVFDLQRSTVSNVDFFNSNYGIFGQNVAQNEAGTFWPRGSQNKYIFGSGVWFGAKKINPNTNELNNYCVVSYDPNIGKSWMVPGSIDQADTLQPQYASNNRIYASTDYNSDATPNGVNWGPNWPLWITDNTQAMEYGTYAHAYILDTALRNYTSYPNGPLFVSGEDMYSRFKDTDLNSYVGGAVNAAAKGYPLRTQFEQKIYSWNTTELQDVVVLVYTVENKSQDTLMDCWFAPMFDADIVANMNNSSSSKASNDRCRYYIENPDLNLAVMWSEATNGDEANGLGYMGISFIESPAVYPNGFLRTDQNIYLPSEQLGLKTFKNWNISEDLSNETTRYNAMSAQVKDGDLGSGDKRLLMATGPFNLRPGDKTRVAVAISFAMPAKGGEADGTTEDIEGGLAPGKYPVLQSNNLSLGQKLDILETKYYENILSVNSDEISNLSINGVFPNPTNKAISIEYQLQNSGLISIGLFNQLGEEVQELYSGQMSKGKQSNHYILNTHNLSNGIYYIRIQSGSEIKTKAVSIIK